MKNTVVFHGTLYIYVNIFSFVSELICFRYGFEYGKY